MEDPKTMADTKPAAEPVVTFEVHKRTVDQAGIASTYDGEVFVDGVHDGVLTLNVANAELEVGQRYTIRGRGLGEVGDNLKPQATPV